MYTPLTRELLGSRKRDVNKNDKILFIKQIHVRFFKTGMLGIYQLKYIKNNTNVTASMNGIKSVLYSNINNEIKKKNIYARVVYIICMCLQLKSSIESVKKMIAEGR